MNICTKVLDSLCIFSCKLNLDHLGVWMCYITRKYSNSIVLTHEWTQHSKLQSLDIKSIKHQLYSSVWSFKCITVISGCWQATGTLYSSTSEWVYTKKLLCGFNCVTWGISKQFGSIQKSDTSDSDTMFIHMNRSLICFLCRSRVTMIRTSSEEIMHEEKYIDKRNTFFINIMSWLTQATRETANSEFPINIFSHILSCMCQRIYGGQQIHERFHLSVLGGFTLIRK